MSLEDLARIDLFRDLSREQLHCDVAGESVTRDRGDVLFREGDAVDGFFVVVEGELEVSRRIRGQRVAINTFREGTTFGEVPLLSGTPHLADGIARTPLRLFRMSVGAFWSMMGNCEEVRGRILAHMSDRNAQLNRLSFQREKLASLGTLAAGLAHELNNPASAARRTADRLLETVETFNRNAAGMLGPAVLREPPADEAAAASVDAPACAFASVRKHASEVAPPELPGARPRLGPLERSEREEALLDWFDEIGLEDGDELAENLVAFGFTAEQLRSFTGRIRDESVAPFVRWIGSESEMRMLVGDLRTGASRISEIVAAMKSYSYMDRQDDHAPVDLRRGIEDTIVILAHRTRDKNVTLRADVADDLPEIVGVGGELNQVLTNLIDNAIDASPKEGEIVIRAHRHPTDDRCVRIEVEDHGDGVPESVRDRLFDPFTTTKPAGRGTGLGLDISYRIVTDRHGGRIDFASEPGRTVFRVDLPIHRATGATETAEDPTR